MRIIHTAPVYMCFCAAVLFLADVVHAETSGSISFFFTRVAGEEVAKNIIIRYTVKVHTERHLLFMETLQQYLSL